MTDRGYEPMTDKDADRICEKYIFPAIEQYIDNHPDKAGAFAGGRHDKTELRNAMIKIPKMNEHGAIFKKREEFFGKRVDDYFEELLVGIKHGAQIGGARAISAGMAAEAREAARHPKQARKLSKAQKRYYNRLGASLDALSRAGLWGYAPNVAKRKRVPKVSFNKKGLTYVKTHRPSERQLRAWLAPRKGEAS